MPPVSRSRHGAAALVAACAFGALAAHVQSAAAATSSVESVSTSSLPSDWASGDNWSLAASACATESCVTVGSYEFVGPPSSQVHGLIVPIAAGVAGAGVAAPLPSNAAAPTDVNTDDLLDAVSCWSSGSCVAVGYYTDSDDDQQALVVPITNGVPGSAEEVTLPSNAGADPNGDLYGISCYASGTCVAVGTYEDSADATNELVVAIDDGAPATGVEVLAPSSSNPNPYGELDSVSCQSDGTCTAVGWYYDDLSGDYAGMVVPITGGTPGAAAEITSLPGGASPQNAFLDDVSCPATGTCTALGYYNDYGNSLVVPITNGVASQGTEALAPSDSTTPAISFEGLSCQSSGACLAVGSYNTAANVEAAVIPISNGVPSPGVEVSLPSDAEADGQSASLSGVSCPASGACLAAGEYRNLTGNQVGMTVSFDAGSVGPGVESQAPADESTAANAWAGYEVVACAATSCAATGSYSGPSDAPYVLSVQSPLAIGTTSLPGGAVGSAYAQTLSATGAWGAYSWAVSAGSLPAGLSLNAQTGSISGTPTAGGTSAFTVTATGTGVPAQTAAQTYSVTITAPPATPAATPKLSLVTKSALVSRNRFGLRLRCAAAPCRGTVRLQISQTYTVKHGKKRVHKHRTVVIGSARFSLAAAQTKTLMVTLNAAGRRALVAKHKLTVTVTATVDGVKEAAGRLALKAAPVKHKKHKKHKKK